MQLTVSRSRLRPSLVVCFLATGVLGGALFFPACSDASDSGAGGAAGSAGSGAGGAAGDGGSGGAGAGGGGSSGCALPYLGDPQKAPELSLLVRGVDGVSVPLVDGASVPLVTPPQGGKVVFLGVRATNLSPCSVTLTGSIRDPASQQLRLDGRVVNLVAAADGWGVSADSNISTFANVPVCPNQWASMDIPDKDFELTVELVDRDKRMVSKTVKARPTCAETDPELAKECACTCKKDYVLGQVCN